MNQNNEVEVVECAAGALFELISDREKRNAWVGRLAKVEGLNVSAAETELHLLELFTIQLALRTAPTQKTRNLAAPIFGRLMDMVATAWMRIWNRDELLAAVENRIESYSKLNHSPIGLDSEEMIKAIGIGYAMNSHDAYSPRDEIGQLSPERFAKTLGQLLREKHNIVTGVGRDVFQDRLESTHRLSTW